jgi:putative membrane protein
VTGCSIYTIKTFNKFAPVISYNPKDWFTFIFRFHKADTFRKLLPMIIAIMLYTAFIAYAEMEFFNLSDNHQLKNLSIAHSMLTFVISGLLVFRINSAYDRWWEARKLWGSLVNNSRNLALKLAAMLNEAEARLYFAQTIGNYPVALKNHLRNVVHANELTPTADFAPQNLGNDKHIPNAIAALMYRKVHGMHKNGEITGEQLLFLNNELMSFTDVCGACERIKNTPIPYSYSAFLKKFIFFFVMSLPFSLVFSLGYYSIPVVGFIFYALTSLELISEEIEDPFGKDANDLPTDNIAKNIRKSVNEIFGTE